MANDVLEGEVVRRGKDGVKRLYRGGKLAGYVQEDAPVKEIPGHAHVSLSVSLSSSWQGALGRDRRLSDL
jgi:hypothetical protein